MRKYILLRLRDRLVSLVLFSLVLFFFCLSLAPRSIRQNAQNSAFVPLPVQTEGQSILDQYLSFLSGQYSLNDGETTAAEEAVARLPISLRVLGLNWLSLLVIGALFCFLGTYLARRRKGKRGSSVLSLALASVPPFFLWMLLTIAFLATSRPVRPELYWLLNAPFWGFAFYLAKKSTSAYLNGLPAFQRGRCSLLVLCMRVFHLLLKLSYFWVPLWVFASIFSEMAGWTMPGISSLLVHSLGSLDLPAVYASLLFYACCNSLLLWITDILFAVSSKIPPDLERI